MPEERGWGFQQELPDVGSFLSSNSPVRWRSFPHRTAITTEMLSPENYDLSELQDWGLPLDLITHEASTWETRLKASARATVVVRGLSAGEHEPYLADRYDSPWRHLGPKFGSGGIFMAGANARDPKTEQKLIDAARALHGVNPSASVALTVYDGFPEAGKLQQKLINPWLRYLEGPLPRADGRRIAIEEELAGRQPLGPLIRKWRRLREELSEEGW